MADDLDNTILENAQGPAEVKGDSVSVRQHDLKDQVEADRYLASRSHRAGRNRPQPWWAARRAGATC